MTAAMKGAWPPSGVGLLADSEWGLPIGGATPKFLGGPNLHLAPANRQLCQYLTTQFLQARCPS